MAVQYIDMTGKTEDEAISKALAMLGLERDEVSVEILERPKAGLFKLFGASPAKVRVSYGLEEEESAPQTVEPVPAASPRQSRQDPVPAVQETVTLSQPVQKSPTGPVAQETDAQPPVAPPQPEPPLEDSGQLCSDEKAQKISQFLTGLLQHMDCEAQVKVYKPEEGRYKVILEGDKLGRLIGRRGETLDAIQQLTSYAVNRSGEKRVRIHVDAENYRYKREQSLCSLARKVAAKVVRNRRNVTLEPMNAYERHVIHTALQDVEGITTYSVGTEPNRRVIVAYDRSPKELKQK